MFPFHRNSSPKSKPRRRALRPRIEGLESRDLKTVGFSIVAGHLSITGDGAADTITIDSHGDDLVVNNSNIPLVDIFRGVSIETGRNSGGGADTVNILTLPEDQLTVDFQGSPAIINLGKAGSTQGIETAVAFFNYGGNSTINFDNSADTTGRTVTMEGFDSDRINHLEGLTGDFIDFDVNGLQALTIRGGAGGNTFNLNRTFTPAANVRGPAVVTNLFAGPGGDLVNVRATAGRLAIHGEAGRDSVNIGDNGRMDKIRGPVSVDNIGSFTTLTVDNSADATPRTVFIDGTRVSGLNGIADVTYAANDLNTLFVKAGNGGNFFQVNDTFKAASATSASSTTISTGRGSDIVNVRRTSGALNILGESGADVVTLSDSNSVQNIQGEVFVNNTDSRSKLNLINAAQFLTKNVTIDADVATGRNSVTGLAPVRISFAQNDVSDLNISTGDRVDTFFVRGTNGNTTQIHAGGGDDQFFVGSAVNDIGTIRRPVLLDGQAGNDFVDIFDHESPTKHTYTQTTTSVTRSSTADPTVVINFASIFDLDLFKGPVTNASPPLVKNLKLSKGVKAGRFATLTGRLEDDDKADTLTLQVDWGDGSAPTVIQPGRRPFSLKHKYAAPGDYAVRVIWTDSQGDSNSRDVPLTVAAQSGPSGPRALMPRRS